MGTSHGAYKFSQKPDGDALAMEVIEAMLADHLKDHFDVSEVSRTTTGPDAFYADLSDRVASGVIDFTFDRAILVCGTGIRAALTHDTYSAERAALSNNAQIITVGARHRHGTGQGDRRRLLGFDL